MSGIGSGYDYSVTTYSPDGKVFQTEYAQKAVDNSQTAVGIRCKDGVLLACEKPASSKLVVPHSTRRMFAIAKHAGVGSAGLPADGRKIANVATDECQSYKSTYGVPIPGHVLAERMGSHLHLYNLNGHSRPYGTGTLLATHDAKRGHALYLLETSGTANRFFGTAIGKHRQAAKNEIEKLKLGEMTCGEALLPVAKMFLSQRDDQKEHEIEMAWLTEETEWQFRQVPLERVKEAEAAAAQAQLDDSDMDDD